MIKNYFKIAWRNLIKSKVYSLINILGLATGMAVAMLIAFWIRDETAYNDYHANHDQIAQVMTTYTVSFQAIKAAMANPVESLRSE